MMHLTYLNNFEGKQSNGCSFLFLYIFLLQLLLLLLLLSLLLFSLAFLQHSNKVSSVKLRKLKQKKG